VEFFPVRFAGPTLFVLAVVFPLRESVLLRIIFLAGLARSEPPIGGLWVAVELVNLLPMQAFQAFLHEKTPREKTSVYAMWSRISFRRA
jgi:hypothetical protein